MNQMRLIFALFFFLPVMGCATFHPRPLEDVPFRDRAQTQEKEKVRVTASVLSADETKKVFDLDLYKRGIQPIWLEIENNADGPVFFLPVGLDPEYFAPLEIAYMHHGAFSGNINKQIDRYFHEKTMKSYVPQGDVRSGFVFTNMDRGTKRFVVDLIGKNQARSYTFFMAVPGLKTSHQEIDWENLYGKDEWISYRGEEPFRQALTTLPCCTTDADGARQGAPLNLIIVARGEDLHHALIRSGWDETEKAETATGKSKASSTNSLQRNRYAPVSPHYLFGRQQDAAFRKSRQSVGERNQIRLWLAPMRFEDRSVWVGQISREIELRFLPSVYQLEPMVDEARLYLLQDFWISQGLAKFGHVKGVGAATLSEPHTSFNDDPYFTDGLRLVVWVSQGSVAFSEVDVLEWERWQPHAEVSKE